VVRAKGKKIIIEQHSGRGAKMSELLLEWAAPLLHRCPRARGAAATA
jgi:hypothetical protein